MNPFLVAVTVLVTGASMHPIHTTVTTAVVNEAHHSVTLNIRAFADDFSNVVAAAAGHAAPKDSSAQADEVVRYVRAHFTIAGATLESCGIRRVDDAYLLCFRAQLPRALGTAAMRNTMLTDLHGDQVNIVQVQNGSARRTHLFTKNASAQPLLDGGA